MDRNTENQIKVIPGDDKHPFSIVVIDGELYEKIDGKLTRKLKVRPFVPPEFMDRRNKVVSKREKLKAEYERITNTLVEMENSVNSKMDSKAKDLINRKKELEFKIKKCDLEENAWDEEYESYAASMIEVKHLENRVVYIKEWNTVLSATEEIDGVDMDFKYVEHDAINGDKTIHCEHVKLIYIPLLEFRKIIGEERFLRRQTLQKMIKKYDKSNSVS